MRDTNSGILVGRLVRDAEVSYTNAGLAKARFSIAFNRSVKKGTEYQDESNYTDLVLWGKQAEGLSKYLLKGKQVCVTYELRQNRYEKDGATVSKLELAVQNIQLLAGNGKPAGGQEPIEASSAPVGGAYAHQPDYGFSDDDDIPF